MPQPCPCDWIDFVKALPDVIKQLDTSYGAIAVYVVVGALLVYFLMPRFSEFIRALKGH